MRKTYYSLSLPFVVDRGTFRLDWCVSQNFHRAIVNLANQHHTSARVVYAFSCANFYEKKNPLFLRNLKNRYGKIYDELVVDTRYNNIREGNISKKLYKTKIIHEVPLRFSVVRTRPYTGNSLRTDSKSRLPQ